MTRRLLVIDDDQAGCRLMRAVFASEFEVSAAHDGRSGLARAAADRPDVILLDLQLPDLHGLEVLERLRQTDASVPVVMMTAHGEVKTAVRATQLGAFDYLTKPIDHEEITMIVGRAVETRALKAEVEALRRQVGDGGLAAQMGPSPQVAQIIEQVRTVAASGFSVLVLGETGSGKELVAQAIHRASERRGRPFVALDCGAIPEPLLESELFGHEKGAFTGADRKKAGRFQLADGGTVFLDEVGNLPVALQSKLLRVLESRQVQAVGADRTTPMDVRFVAATNEDLHVRAGDGRFRADLYFRLAQYTITLPPLRARPADIAYLVARFIAEATVELRCPIHEVAPDALALLEKHAWPGNVRELRNVVRRLVLEAKGGVVGRALVARFLGRDRASSTSSAAAATSVKATAGRSLKEVATEAARAAERELICDTLRETQGNKSRAARALQTDYKTLHLKLKSLGIRARDFAP
jgi:DNA-binding NtrC family response regulator